MKTKNQTLRVLVAGCGNMGASHAIAYHNLEGFEICGLVSRGESKNKLNEKLGGHYDLFVDFEQALACTKPDAVCISTYPDTHEAYAIKAMESGCHVFIEKPLADTVAGAERVAAAARKMQKKLVVGYILRYHPAWQKFIELARTLGKPLVMRMNLNQQSQAEKWMVHQNLLKSLSPIVDCGVHYLDVMCQMTQSRPVEVNAIGARLSNAIAAHTYNYGQLQIWFEDGSVGWYESGWGPMMSDTAFFIKDVIGPEGAVSIVAGKAAADGNSADIDSHTRTASLKLHRAKLDASGHFAEPDIWMDMRDEPDHQELCNREQRAFLNAIRYDIELNEATADALSSLRIALACDESIRKNKRVKLGS